MSESDRSESTKTRKATAFSLSGLALTFLKTGTIGFGGGMAIIALMEHELVRKRRIVEADEFLHGVGRLAKARALTRALLMPTCNWKA
ncbi:MAG: chromate transporter [Acidobacteriia bacterium]|nr:chromate transporter [Terriglobia bacterium]